MYGISDQHDAATVPVVEVHLFSGVTVDLLITRDGSKPLLDLLSEACKSLPNTFKATLQWVLCSFRCPGKHVPKERRGTT